MPAFITVALAPTNLMAVQEGPTNLLIDSSLVTTAAANFSFPVLKKSVYEHPVSQLYYRTL